MLTYYIDAMTYIKVSLTANEALPLTAEWVLSNLFNLKVS